MVQLNYYSILKYTIIIKTINELCIVKSENKILEMFNLDVYKLVKL